MPPAKWNDHAAKSSYRERLIEHVFVGELLRELWRLGYRDVEVLKPEVDQGGYDLVLECQGVLRYVQFKASFDGSTTASVNVNARLATRPGGCVLWIVFDESTLELGPFLWFGGQIGEALPDLSGLKIARRATANSQGIKPVRPNIRCLPKSKCERLANLDEVIHRLFGLRDPAHAVAPTITPRPTS